MATLAVDYARPHSRTALWTGRALSGFAAAFMTFDAALHLAKPAIVTDAFTQLGFPASQSVTIGAIALIAVILYLTPRTAVMGSILLTGYLGGAIATQMRIGAPVFNLIFPILIAALFWGGLALRDRRVARWLIA